MIVKSNLDSFWTAKEREFGRTISIYEVAKATGFAWETIKNLKTGKTGRYDKLLLGRVCAFFGLGSGNIVPFLILDWEEDE